MSALARIGRQFFSFSPYRSFTNSPLGGLNNSVVNEVDTWCKPINLLTTTVRTRIRYHFPRPSERKRIKRHGWWARMATPAGRRIIMNRILKGKFVYTH